MASVIGIASDASQIGTFVALTAQSKAFETRNEILKECMARQRSMLEYLERYLHQVLHSKGHIDDYSKLVRSLQDLTKRLFVMLNKYPSSKHENKTGVGNNSAETAGSAPSKARFSLGKTKRFVIKKCHTVTFELWEGAEEARNLRTDINELETRIMEVSTATLFNNLLASLNTGITALEELDRDVAIAKERLTRENVLNFQDRLIAIMTEISEQKLPKASAAIYMAHARERLNSADIESMGEVPLSAHLPGTINISEFDEDSAGESLTYNPFADSVDITEFRAIAVS
ncbi:hypothetical protein VKT23_013598 [Stygiomarasmius scandens]|uniref:Fungal N-terminal domain-containing protein n=1 Tax=Marasmiellus scandens TaxID=2682957 RepID=A0ABR1J2X8_9AGAR